MNRKDKYQSKYSILRFLQNCEEVKLTTKYGHGIVSLYYLVHLYWLSFYAYQPSIERSLLDEKELRTTKGICPRCFSVVYYFDNAESCISHHRKVCDKRQQLLNRELGRTGYGETYIHRKAKYFKLNTDKLTEFYDFLENNSFFFQQNNYLI